MTTARDKVRILIALTESSPVPRLWKAALDKHSEMPADLVTLFLQDERWLRAASLPFTREYPRSGGRSLKFTQQRAHQIGQETARQARKLIDQLAAKSKLRVAFETLAASDRPRLVEIIGEYKSILIAAEAITSLPVYVHFVELGCHIELIGSTAETENGETES